ncbi:clavesin-2-like [Photinus pyralis]|nr:clavesin-2-like [Photinus pyralis]XP_031356526.1 clavesin-2-like [Photinus pyralis]XP_031356527.1 clavesin-2-like [Photinus pyralis]XP_031356528.1 clavesin-2-like [Photinus pyralis]
MTTAHLIIPSQPEKGEVTERQRNFVLKVAAKELKEDEQTREQCLARLREWIHQNRDIQGCILDDRFLLRFLRSKKFSLHMTQQMVLKYLNLRKCFSHICSGLDWKDERFLRLLNEGYTFPSPFRDKNGRRVVLTVLKKFNTSLFTSTDMARAHTITYETMMDDEETQVLGFNHVIDIAGASPSIITMWPPNEFATLVKWADQSFPMRHKEINVVHLPSMFKYVYDFAASRVSQKIRDRTKFHDTLADLHKVLDPPTLPSEYGGIMSTNEMIELWKEELINKRDRLLSYDRMNLLSDQGIIRRRTKINDADSLNGSFRRLHVD